LVFYALPQMERAYGVLKNSFSKISLTHDFMHVTS